LFREGCDEVSAIYCLTGLWDIRSPMILGMRSDSKNRRIREVYLPLEPEERGATLPTL
jgi:hypothetical protein